MWCEMRERGTETDVSETILWYLCGSGVMINSINWKKP